MASEVKGAHPGILKILSSCQPLRSEPLDLRHLVCTAFFLPGLQPEGCTKQLIEVEVGWPVAWTGRLQAREPAPQKIMRTSRRLFKTAGSRSNERGGVLGRLDARAAAGQGHPAPLQLGQSRAGLEAKPT